jgi:hypothetical protein
MPNAGPIISPHFDLPFRIGTKTAEVQQDTIDDVTNCVEVCVRTHIGRRKELPQFGIEDLTLRDQPVRMADVLRRIAENEPRAIVLIDQHPDLLDELIARVRMGVQLREETSA